MYYESCLVYCKRCTQWSIKYLPFRRKSIYWVGVHYLGLRLISKFHNINLSTYEHIDHKPLICPQIYCELEQKIKITGINWLKISIQEKIKQDYIQQINVSKPNLQLGQNHICVILSHRCETITPARYFNLHRF